MNIKKLFGLLVCIPLISAGNLFAGENNRLTLVSTSGVVGGQVDIKVYWQDDSPFSGTMDFRIAYDEAEFSFVSCQEFPDGWTFFGCAQTQGAGTVNVAVGDFASPPIMGSGGDNTDHLFTLTFDVITTTAGSYTIAIDPTYDDGDPDPDPVVTTDGNATETTNANVDILGPAYDSINGFAPNASINFGSAVVSTTNPSATFDIDNVGESGTSLDGNCSIIGADASAFILVSGSSFSVPEAGPDQGVEVQCSTANIGTFNMATLQCTHNGGPPGAASPVNYPLSCSIIDRDRPTYSSTNPTIGGSFAFGDLLTSDANVDLTMTIENTGTDQQEGLTGNCSITNNPNGAYSIQAGGGAYGSLAIGETHDVIVRCDTGVTGDHNGGNLRCTADDPASNAGNFDYPLNCTVTSLPTYSSTPADGNPIAALTAMEGNGPGPAENLNIENTGEPLSTLEGSCILNGSDSEISFASSSAFSVAEGASTNILLVCEGDVGTYSNNVQCTANAPATNAGTFNYPVNCTVDQPDPAVYSSSPYAGGNPGDLIDVNEGNPPPPVNNGITPSTVLTITNAADAGDDDLVLDDCEYTGDPEITTTPALLNTTLAPGASTNVTFNCATDTTDATTTFSGTYTCPFDEQPTPPPIVGVEGGSGIKSPATYPVECDVREQYADVVEDPASGTPQTVELMPNEQHTFSFTFTEEIDENLDGEIDCSLATGTDFAITMNPGTTTVPSGDSVQVDVTFTDPGQGDTFTDTLNCTISDNEPDSGIEGIGTEEDVSWPLEVTVIGRNATFLVTKDFDDDNPMPVQVALDCNTGLPLFQTGTLHDGDAAGLNPGQFTELEFIIVDFEPGDLNCEVYETSVPFGYEAGYNGDYGEDGVAASAGETDDACVYTGIESADFTCEIYNSLQEVDLTVNKEWIDDNPGFNLPTWVEIEVQCFNLAENMPFGPDAGYCELEGGADVCFTDYIDPAYPGNYGFYPHWNGSTYCTVTESLEPGAEGDVSDCASVPLAPGVDGECTIVNTRLYEGIPTLSQYGLILMALMMLGVGMVAFRRYS